MTYQQLADGVRGKDEYADRWRIPPVGIARRTFYRILKRLKELGVVVVNSVDHKFTEIRINMQWSPAEGVPSVEAEMARLAVPKRLQNRDAEPSDEAWGDEEAVPQRHNPSARLAPARCQDGTPIEQRGEQRVSKQNETLERPAAPAVAGRTFEWVEDEVGEGTSSSALPSPAKSEVSEANAASDPSPHCAPPPSPRRTAVQAIKSVLSRKAPVEGRHGKTDKGASYSETFAAAWRETYEDVPCPSLTQRDAMILAKVLKANLRFEGVEGQHDFLDFVVRNWRQIMHKEFAWMTRIPPPEMPCTRFLSTKKFLPRFLGAYAYRREYDRVKLLPQEEREVEDLVHRGMTREEALVDVGRRRTLAEARKITDQVRARNWSTATRGERMREEAMEERKRTLALLAKAKAEDRRKREEQGETEPRLPVHHDINDELPPFEMPEIGEMKPFDEDS